jgi:antitoxin HicB
MSATDDQELYKRYSMVIEWSDEDDAYVVTLPEFPSCHTHGATREEALKNGQEVLELLVEANKEWGQPFPPPKLFHVEESATEAESESSQLDEYEPQKVS